MSFSNLSVKHLFATPFVMASFAPDVSAELNRNLTALVLKQAERHPGVQVSNAGGWQSQDNILEWGGEPVRTILSALRELIGQVTLYREGKSFRRGELDWTINGWANINRKGDTNVLHTHPGGYWSAVYYVATGDNAETGGGELELVDPRGVMPILYNPLLRFGLEGYVSAGGSELHKPEAGQCILFPSWLSHGVKPYTGEGVRISLAFNFAL